MQRQWKLCLLTFSFAMFALFALMPNSPLKAQNTHPLTFTTIDFPSSTGTLANKVNARDEIVGTYADSVNASHGLLLKAGSFTTVDFPGAINTALEGINDRTDITGAYDDSSGVTHGFEHATR